MEFFVKNNVDVNKYGFEPCNYGYWWRKNRHSAVNMILYMDRHISFQSASKDCIAVICEMYKNGDIEFVKDEDLTTMKLTSDEVELITERRNNEKKNH